jgi:Transmembrane domain of unknown function (DUF3566)
VSSPNEPGSGNGRSGGPRSQGSGPISTSGPVADHSEVPPWQRGPAARAGQARRAASDAPATGPGVDDRINRFISGSASPAQAPESDATPPPPSRTETYRSELPDLSGPVPRPAVPRKAQPERPGSEPTGLSATTSRVQVGTRPRGPLRAGMQIRRVDPWSVLKVSLVLSVALFFVWMIAVAFLYLVLGGMGVWSKLNSNVGDLLTNTSSTELVSSGAIFGGAALIGLVNIVLLTAMATAGAFIYNLTTDLVGGVEVTLADRD